MHAGLDTGSGRVNSDGSDVHADAALEGKSQGAVTQATGFAYAARSVGGRRPAPSGVHNSVQ